MKKIVLTLLLTFSLLIPLSATDGTVNIIFSNGTVSYTDTQTFYEFDVLAYIDGGSGSNIFKNGMVYVEYDTMIFGSYLMTNSKASFTFKGPLAEKVGPVPLYQKLNQGNDSGSNKVAFSFEGHQDFQFYGSETYISNQSNSPDTIMTIKMEVKRTGTSTVIYPADIDKLNEIFTEYIDDNNLEIYDGISIASATETTYILYSDSGDPATPITLKEFAGGYDEGAVTLNWTTASESQNMGFILKRAVLDGGPLFYQVIASYLNNDDLLGAGTTAQENNYSFTDTRVRPGLTYSYMLEDVDYSNNVVQHAPLTVSIPENILFANADFRLEPVYPNPFNPAFTLPFELNRAMDVRINMYDISGRQVRTIANGHMQAGRYDTRVDASHLNSGIYFVRAVIGDQVLTQKVLLVK
jgi:hypothetical protein